MSELEQGSHGGGGRHRPERRRGRVRGCLPVLVALVILVGGGYLVFTYGAQAIKNHLSSPDDYSGNGTGTVLVEVKSGATASDIASTLKAKDVIKSAGAFTDAARNDPKSTGIQFGFYQLKRHMSASAALVVLEDPHNLVQTLVTIPEGFTVSQIVARLVAHTNFSTAQFKAVLAKPSSIGLPAYAKGSEEGFLFPATYPFPPNATPTTMLATMVSRFKQSATGADLAGRASTLGHSEYDLVIVASLIQAEARNAPDFGKVSRVIYNRLEQGMPLQFDSTIHYLLKKKGILSTTIDQTHIDSPYNTYRNKGLPPTPIMAPGDQAIRAALTPAPGNWLYFVTTNPRTGKTKFTASYSTFLQYKAEYTQYCQTSDVC
ncbi:MAG: endolytic transglycosylase MltG [Nocardioidaceae bacterium]